MDYDNEFPSDDELEETEEESFHGSRFGDGQPGNTFGRPPGSQNRRTIIKRVANKRHPVKIDGKSRSKSTIYLVMRSIRNTASRGDLPAFALAEKLMRQFSPKVTHVRPAVLVIGEQLTQEEWCAVYGTEMSDAECEEHFPYLLDHRRRFRAHQDSVSEQTLNAQRPSGSGSI